MIDGDYGIAVSTGEEGRIEDKDITPFFATTIECGEEALLDSVFMAETTHGPGGHVRHALPIDHVLAKLGL